MSESRFTWTPKRRGAVLIPPVQARARRAGNGHGGPLRPDAVASPRLIDLAIDSQVLVGLGHGDRHARRRGHGIGLLSSTTVYVRPISSLTGQTPRPSTALVSSRTWKVKPPRSKRWLGSAGLVTRLEITRRPCLGLRFGAA